MSMLIGALLALAVGGLGTWIGLDRERGFYPTVMIVVASYYVLFAVMGGSLESLGSECGVMAAFVVLSLVGFRRTQWLIVIALAGHGVFDWVHPRVIDNPGVPSWWAGFCLAYDVVAAGYLAVVLVRKRHQDLS